MKNLVNKSSIILLLLLSVVYVYAQDSIDFECATPKPSAKKFKERFYYKNNQALIDSAYAKGFIMDSLLIKSMGFELPKKRPIQVESFIRPGEVTTNLADGNYTGVHYLPVAHVPVQAYIWASDAGTLPRIGGNNVTPDVIDTEIARLNQYFRDSRVPIRFYQTARPLLGNSSRYHNIGSDGTFVEMCGFPGPAAIKIHFVNSIDIDGRRAAGKARFPGDRNDYALALTSGAINPTLAHEIGHVLDLVHTHESARSNKANNAECDPCHQESVSRSRRQGFCVLTGTGPKKCEVNGDGFCDTEADPDVTDFMSGCNYTGTGADHWNDRWRPDIRNIMSYAGTCRNRFTTMQAFWMSLHVPAYAREANYAISGSSRACPNQTINYSVPALSGVNTYNWEVPDGWVITAGLGSRSITVRTGANPAGVVRAIPDYGQPLAELAVSDSRSFLTISTDLGYLCRGENNFVYAGGGSGSFQWTVPSGVSIVSGQGTSRLQVWVSGSFSGGTIRLSANVNGCTGSTFHSMNARDCNGDNPIQYVSLPSLALDSITSVVNEPDQPEVLLYPNPAIKGETIVQMPKAGNYQVEIRDHWGNLLFKQEVKQQQRINLNVSAYPIGLYYVSVLSSEGKVVKTLSIQ